jgi:replicative DNA helicase
MAARNSEIILEPDFSKSLPYSMEAEIAVLGAIILDNNIVYQAIDLLGQEGIDIHLWSHRTIYRKMVLLANRGSVIDLVTLTDELKKTNEFEQVRGYDGIHSLIDGVPRMDNVEHHVKIIKKKSHLRKLIAVANQIAANCFDEEDEVEVIQELAERLIFELSTDNKINNTEHVSIIASRLADFYEVKAQNSDALIGLSTGYSDLDKRTSGLVNVTILAGRPGHCKTATAINIACRVAYAGGLVYYCTPESPREQIAQRILASQARIDSMRMREGRMDRDEWGKLLDVLRRLTVTQFYIDDQSDITPEALYSRCRQYKLVHGRLDLLIVDYIQLMARWLMGDKKRRFNSLREAVQHVSAYLVKIAKDLQVPVLGLAQLSREVDNRPGHRPQMSDLAESACLEQDADLVIFSLREEKYEATEINEGILKLIFGKFRDGSTRKDIDMAFIESQTRLESLYRED